MDSASLDDHDVDVVHALEPFGSLEDDDTQHEAMIAEATAAALAASASNTVDVVAVDAAALAAESAANLVDAAGVPVVSMHASSNDRKNEQRRKRYRERVLAEDYNYNEETGETTRRRTPREEGTGGATSSADDSTTGDHSSASRRARDRERYANMTQEERDAYNARRRKQYTQQSDAVRQRRRQRERARYHSMPEDKVKERNAKRARLERERYKKMPKEVLEERNRKRRERAAAARKKKMADVAEAVRTRCLVDRLHLTLRISGYLSRQPSPLKTQSRVTSTPIREKIPRRRALPVPWTRPPPDYSWTTVLLLVG